jgi:hypothetical protein
MGRRLVVAMSVMLCLVTSAGAQTPEERAVARDLIAKHGDAVIIVLGTTKVRVNQGGKEVQNQDQRLPEVAGWQSTAMFFTVQAVVEKPRTFYFLTGGTAGSPVFDTRGRFVGIVLRLKNEADAAAAPFILLPASDIREVAKQAK